MKLARKDIEIIILEHLRDIGKHRKSMYELNMRLSEVNVPFGLIESILSNEEVIAELEVPILIGLTIAIHDYTKSSDVKPENFYSDREIRDAIDIMNNVVTEKVLLPIPLNDVIKIKFDSYVTKINIKDLVQMFHSQLIVYDYETQRGANYKTNKAGGIVKTPIVNKSSVKRIAERVSSNRYFEDTIILNVYSTEVEPITYNEEARILTINDGAIISILDGFHRLQGFISALEINPNIDLFEILSIRSYDHDTAQRFFGQINTINILKKERRNELSQEKLSDKVVANLQRKLEIGQQIGSGDSVSVLAGELTSFDILSYVIDSTYNLNRQFDVIVTTDYLSEFFTYLVGIYPEEFSVNSKNRTKPLMSKPLMFIGYVVLSKVMKDKEKNLREISKYIDTIDFSDQKLVNLLLSKKGNTKHVRNSIIEYFDSLFRGV